MRAIAETSADLRAVGNEHLNGVESMAVLAGVDLTELDEWSEEEARRVLAGMKGAVAEPDQKTADLAAAFRVLAVVSLRIGFVAGAHWKGSQDG